MRWLIAVALPLGLWSCGEAATPRAQEAPVDAQDAPVEAQAALSDQEYLVHLGLIRGHLLVGHGLYRLNALDAARSHSKHPTDELYAGMEPEFAARGTTGSVQSWKRMRWPPKARMRQPSTRRTRLSRQRSRAPKPRSRYRRR